MIFVMALILLSSFLELISSDTYPTAFSIIEKILPTIGKPDASAPVSLRAVDAPSAAYFYLASSKWLLLFWNTPVFAIRQALK